MNGIAKILLIGAAVFLLGGAAHAELPMFQTDGHSDKDTLAAVEKTLVEIGQIDKLPDNSKIITEEFLK